MGLQQFDEQLPFNSAGAMPNDGGAGNVGVAQDTHRTLRVDSLYLGNSAVAATVVQVALQDGFGNLGKLGGISLPGGAGDTSPAVNVFAALLDANQQFILIVPGNTLLLTVPGGALSGAVVSWFASGGSL